MRFIFDVKNKFAIKEFNGQPSEISQDEGPGIWGENNIYSSEDIDLKKVGKWMLYCQQDKANEMWSKIKEGIRSGKLWKANISTHNPKIKFHAVMIYTKDYTDKEDVIKVLKYLELSGLKEMNYKPVIYYKMEIETATSIYSGKKTWIYSSDTIQQKQQFSCKKQISINISNQQDEKKYKKTKGREASEYLIDKSKINSEQENQYNQLIQIYGDLKKQLDDIRHQIQQHPNYQSQDLLALDQNREFSYTTTAFAQDTSDDHFISAMEVVPVSTALGFSQLEDDAFLASIPASMLEVSSFNNKTLTDKAIDLTVPFSEREQAKELGAKWDAVKRTWYAPNGDLVLAQRWPYRSPLSEFKGEDRNFAGNQLFIDLVPKSCWFTNVRTCIHPADWDRVRKLVYERANNQCECCGEKSLLEAHERWSYNQETKTQKLMRIIALCKDCHQSTHMGFAQTKGFGVQAMQHLMKVTGMNEQQAKDHKRKAFIIWQDRNLQTWSLDLSIITDSGIQLANHLDPQQRKQIASITTLQCSPMTNLEFAANSKPEQKVTLQPKSTSRFTASKRHYGEEDHQSLMKKPKINSEQQCSQEKTSFVPDKNFISLTGSTYSSPAIYGFQNNELKNNPQTAEKEEKSSNQIFFSKK